MVKGLRRLPFTEESRVRIPYMVQKLLVCSTNKPSPRPVSGLKQKLKQKVTGMSGERFSWTEPRLCHYGYDLQRKWFVYFDYTDHLAFETKRLQFRGPINKAKKKEERVRLAAALIAYWKGELSGGWSPFGKDQCQPVIRPTVTEAFAHILELKASSCGKRTLEAYRYIVKLFSEWLTKGRLHNMYIDMLEPVHARSFMDFLQLKKGYSGRTFNGHLTVLSTFCNEMTEREWIKKNPFRKIGKLPVGIGRNTAFTDREKEMLKAHLLAGDLSMYYFTQFIYYCFIRRTELTRLKVGNIDWKNMTIIIPSDVSKNRKQESVVIPVGFAGLLKEMGLQALSPEWYIFGRHLKPGPIIYSNPAHISTRHNTICRQLGIAKEKGLYSWKHSGVCALYPVLNGDIYALMRQLRHTELTTTQIYLKSLGLTDNKAIRNAVW